MVLRQTLGPCSKSLRSHLSSLWSSIWFDLGVVKNSQPLETKPNSSTGSCFYVRLFITPKVTPIKIVRRLLQPCLNSRDIFHKNQKLLAQQPKKSFSFTCRPTKNTLKTMSDSDSSNGGEDKMQQLLAEWDEKDEGFEDGDDDSEAREARARLAALKADDSDSDSDDGGAKADDDDDLESEYELEEVEVEVEEEVEVSANGDDATYQSADSENDDDAEEIVDTLKKKPKKKKEKKETKKITDIDEDDDDEDRAMKALLAGWDAENGGDDDDDDDEDEEDDDDEDSEPEEREVILDDNVIDHIVLAAPDLDEAMGEFEKKTGLAATIAGTIKGLGIKCARISFTDSSYLEIIAPDPKGPGPIGELIKSKGIKELTPFHFAIRSRRAEALKDEVTKFGYTPDHITMFGAKADGTPRKWEMLYLYGHKIGGACPYFINWANSDHPCATLPVVGKLKKVVIRAPEDDPVHKLLEHTKAEGITVEIGDKPKLAVSFSSPEGTVKFSTHRAVGFKFPGFEADVGEVPDGDGEQDADVEFDDPKMPELLPVDGDADAPIDEDYD